MSDSLVFKGQRLLVIGNSDPIHIGAHLRSAAESLELNVSLCNISEAFAGPACLAKLNWWFAGHRPVRLRNFSEQVVQACNQFKPRWLLATGLAPIEAWALEEAARLNVRCLNYLTDDPWNPAHRAPWFMKALPLYDHVFSPRQANLEELEKTGCPRVSYLPFAFSPELHFPEPPITREEQLYFSRDVVFVGGGDQDRVPDIAALIRAGFKVALHGGYWDRYAETKNHTRGHADAETLRKAIGGAKVALCLVRRANRDGSSMRTFELPAMGACMLVEDTDEHRNIFGAEKEAVVYFGSIEEMIEKLRWLLEHDEERRQLARAAHDLIVCRPNTYQNRLITMLSRQSN